MAASDGAGESLADIFARLGVSTIEEYSEFVPQGLKPDAVAELYAGKLSMTGGPHGDKVMYAMGAEFVEVRVHALTREIRVPRIVGAFAAGRLMNTRTAHSQLMGGMIWGISSALHEATEIDTLRARYVNDNLADYLVPVNADVQEVKVQSGVGSRSRRESGGNQGIGRTRKRRHSGGGRQCRLSRDRHPLSAIADPDRRFAVGLGAKFPENLWLRPPLVTRAEKFHLFGPQVLCGGLRCAG